MPESFKTLAKSLVYHNPWMKVYEYKIKRRESTGTYGVVERENTVIVIPLSPSGRTVLLKQYRYPTDKDSWELPMGGIGENESKQAAVSRELCEETSLKAVDCKEIGGYYAAPGLTPQQVFVFIAPVSEEVLELAFAPRDADEIQDIRIEPLVLVYEMVRRGEVTDGFTLAGLFYLKLYMESHGDGYSTDGERSR
jgi:8-oxo-dGTP pyrophosphatase MutT (NUDIX family)